MRYLKIIPHSFLANWSVRYTLDNQFAFRPDFSLIRIGTFLKRSKNDIIIQDEALYKRITIRTNGKGVLLRDEEVGSNIGTKRQFLVSEGQFLISKIDARNGAMGIAPKELDGAIITADFLAFDIDQTIANPYFFWLLSITKQFTAFCQSCSTGTTNRQRLDEQLFLDLKIPLPPLDTQKSLVASYKSALFEADNKETKGKQLEMEMETYLNQFYGVTKNKYSQLKGLFFAEYKNIDRWGIDFAGLRSEWTIQPNFPLFRIGDICKIGSGGTPNRGVKAYYEHGDIPWVKTTEVINEIITQTDECITQAGLENSSARVYPAGSLIIAMYGQGATRGRTAKLGIDAATNQACAVLHDITSNLILTDYLWITLMHEYNRLRELASGNNQPNLNAKMIYNYKIQIADIISQQNMINYFFEKKNEIMSLYGEVNALRTDAIMDFESSIFL
ncbi:restriction endonuclease subunit S [Larkinella rosea]|uniref:Restriction endonuclease subunit S n=1 Tax=Larkinella rosea TaxID=2025312 RepID=A0A3P1BSE4_9BACT|nr:restriction endonuclease subunit S [Larkinella rosea]RRB03967.1 restriction endonuclease subunit S [Larkinella rosea]